MELSYLVFGVMRQVKSELLSWRYARTGGFVQEFRSRSGFLPPAVPMVLALLCIVAIMFVAGLLIAELPRPGMCLAFWAVGFLGATNICWALAMPTMRGERIYWQLWFPWILNCVIAGACLYCATWLILARDDFNLVIVLIGSLAVGMGIGALLHKSHGWIVTALMACVGMVMVGAGVALFMALRGQGHYSGEARLVMLFGAVVVSGLGLMQMVPLGIATIILYANSHNKGSGLYCEKCGYNLYGTLMAGKRVCPECGMEKVAMKREG